jgi:hypothetical protein
MKLLNARAGRRPARRQSTESGQVLLEFLINFVILFFLIWALVEIAMIAGTKLLTNYASWAAARAWSVNVDNGDGMDEAKSAAKDVLKGMNWKSLSDDGVKKTNMSSRDGIEVDYQTTLGIPAFLAHTSSSSVTTKGFSPMIQETMKKDDENNSDNK